MVARLGFAVFRALSALCQPGTPLPRYKCFGKYEVYCFVSYIKLYLQKFSNVSVLSLFAHSYSMAAVWGTTTPNS
jgi:hypothetical protein